MVRTFIDALYQQHVARLSRALLIVVLLAGCQEARNVANVSGRVTLDGQPVADVLVHFQPQVAPAEAAKKTTDAIDSSGITNAEGRFELRLADSDKLGAGGQACRAVLRPRALPLPRMRALPQRRRSRFPARYSDGSKTFEVSADGTDQANFELHVEVTLNRDHGFGTNDTTARRRAFGLN